MPAPAAGEELETEIRDMRDAFQSHSNSRFVDALHKWVHSRGAERVTVLDMNNDESENDDDVVFDLPDAKIALDGDEAAIRFKRQNDDWRERARP
jgi:hypothetical protein